MGGRRTAAAILSTAALASFACTPHRAMRLQPGDDPVRPISTSIAGLQQSEVERQKVQGTSREHHDSQNFRLSIVEFDDRGNLWHAKQQRDALQLAEEAYNDPNGAFLVVYVHGWKHGCGVCDNDLSCFRELLAFLHWRQMQDPLLRVRPRKVVGVYVGWRGLSAENSILKQLTFWTRKRTAERVGKRGVASLLTALSAQHERGQATRPLSRMVVVGHSFGAASVFGAALAGEGNPVALYGDSMVLLNPAFEAAQYRRVHQTLGNGGDEFGRVRLITVGSSGDTATRVLFPAGRIVTAPFRPSTYIRPLSSTITMANYPWFITHRLTGEGLEGLDNPERAGGVCECKSQLFEFLQTQFIASMQASAAFGVNGKDACTTNLWGLRLAPFSESTRKFCNSPFRIARADPDVIKDHGDIFSRSFTWFLYAFLDQQDNANFRAVGLIQ